MKTIIGVMGPGSGAQKKDIDNAFKLGKLIANKGWVVLSGGRNEGVMDAVSKGAKSVNGLTIGILPTKDPLTFSKSLDIAIVTDMGSARNNINVLSSKVVVACGMGAGTASEVALALKAKKQVILICDHEDAKKFFSKIGKVYIALSPDQVIEKIEEMLHQK